MIVRNIVASKSYLDDIPDCEFEPEMKFECNLSFNRLYKEIYQFDNDNNHLNELKTRQIGSCCVNGCTNKVNIRVSDTSNVKYMIMCRENNGEFK